MVEKRCSVEPLRGREARSGELALSMKEVRFAVDLVGFFLVPKRAEPTALSSVLDPVESRNWPMVAVELVGRDRVDLASRNAWGLGEFRTSEPVAFGDDRVGLWRR